MILHHDQVDFSLKFTVGSTQAINKCNTIYKVRTVTTRSHHNGYRKGTGQSLTNFHDESPGDMRIDGYTSK